MSKTIFLQTYGCQMNERDSEEVLGMLAGQGDAIAMQPERVSKPVDAVSIFDEN